MLQSVVVVVLTLASVSSAAELPRELDLTRIRALPVQHDGRWMPLDTLAYDLVESVTGNTFHQHRDPVLWLLAWTFSPQVWMQEPLIGIPNAELRSELQLSASKTTFSYAELIEHPHLRNLIEGLSRIEAGRKLNPLESKVRDINEKLNLLKDVFQGRVIKPIPDANRALAAWRPITASKASASQPVDSPTAAWTALSQAFVADNAAAFSAASEQLTNALSALPAAHRPESSLLAVELRYNRIRPFHTAWRLMAAGAALAALGLVVRRGWFDGLAFVGMLPGFAMLTYGLSLRWQIAGRIPAANMFESLLFLSWGMGAFAILSITLLRHRAVPLTSSMMGAVALVLADSLPIDHYIRPIAPVLLDTVWMSIHVPIIMVSYSVLTLAVLVAHVQLAVMAAAPRKRELTDAIDNLHYWYVHIGSLLLIAGIITGSMWAASSWGRYWGWDPKEVWSLVAFLGYMAILHVRINRDSVPGWAYCVAAMLGLAVLAMIMLRLDSSSGTKLPALTGVALAMLLFVLARGPFATAVKSIIAFWLIVMTYVGVNYVLGTGMHSYGFGTGAVVHYLFLIGGLDLLLVAICCVVHLARGGWQPLKQFTSCRSA